MEKLEEEFKDKFCESIEDTEDGKLVDLSTDTSAEDIWDWITANFVAKDQVVKDLEKAWELCDMWHALNKETAGDTVGDEQQDKFYKILSKYQG